MFRQVDHFSGGQDTYHILNSHQPKRRYKCGFDGKDHISLEPLCLLFEERLFVKGKTDAVTQIVRPNASNIVICSEPSSILIDKRMWIDAWGHDRAYDFVVVFSDFLIKVFCFWHVNKIHSS